MPTLYIICGLPFSGKSFLSQRIADRLGCMRLSYDELWQQKKSQTGQSWGWNELSDLARQHIAAVLDAGQSIIYDTLNDTIGNREALRQLAKEHHAQDVIIFVDTPLSLIRQRQLQNKISNDRHSVPNDKFHEATDRFEPPTPSENPIIFTPSTNFDQWIDALRQIT